MNVKQFQETFSPWFDVVTKTFQGSFSKDYDINILAFLHENIDREIKVVFTSSDRCLTTVRTKALYNVLTYLYEHILWKLRKEDFPNASLSCVKLLSQLIKTGLLLTHGLTECEYIDRILTALKLFTGKPALLYDALLLVNGLKKLHHEPYSVILRCVLKADYKEITDPLLYMEIILLFRRLRALSDSSDENLYSLAKKRKPPSNLISWLVSLNVNGSISFLKLLKHKKIVHQLMKKNIPEPLLKTVRHMILRSYYFEESHNPHREIVSQNPSDLFITDTSSLVMNKIQTDKSCNKTLKKVNSKKEGKRKIKKPVKDSLSNKKMVLSDKKQKVSTISKSDGNMFYINNFSNLVIENQQSDSLQESDASEKHFSSNLVARTSKTVSKNIEECKKSSKKKRKSKHIHKAPLHNEELKNCEIETIDLVDSESSDNVTNVPAKKSKKAYEIDRLSERKEISCQRISSKRDYSEDESLKCSTKSEITNIKHRKKMKYTDDKIVNEYSLENCDTASVSNFENFCITSDEVEIPNENSSNKSEDEEDITFVAEVIRNIGDDLDISKINKQKSLKHSNTFPKDTAEKLQNVAFKDNSVSISDNSKPCDHQTILLENQIPSIQTLSPPESPNSNENSKQSSDKNYDELIEMAENKEASSKFSKEDVSLNSSKRNINCSTNDCTNVTPEWEQITLSSVIQVNQNSSHSSSSSSDTDGHCIHKTAVSHIKEEKLSNAGLSDESYVISKNNSPFSKNDILKAKSDINVKCNDVMNPSYSLDKCVESSHTGILETRSRFTQIPNTQSEISHKCSNTGKMQKVISLSSENSPASKDTSVENLLEKEIEPSVRNNSRCSLSQEIGNLNPKVTFQSGELDKFDSLGSTINENDAKHADQKNSNEVIKEINIPCSSNVTGSNMNVITFVEVVQNNHDSSKDNNVCDNSSQQPVNTSLKTKNKELIVDDANASSSSPLILDGSNDKRMQDNCALNMTSNKEMTQNIGKAQTVSLYDSDKDNNFIEDSEKELPNEKSESLDYKIPIGESKNLSNSFSTNGISDNFKQCANEIVTSIIVKCENTSSKNDVKSEKRISQKADLSTNPSISSESLNSNNKDLGNSSGKSTEEAVLEISAKDKVSEISIKQSIENLPIKSFGSEVKSSDKSNFQTEIIKCSESSNNIDKIVSATIPSISSKIEDQVYEKSVQQVYCFPEKNANYSSSVAPQNDEVMEKVLPKLTGTVSENDVKPEQMTVNVPKNDTNLNCLLLQDHTKSENTQKDLVTEKSYQNDSNTDNVSQDNKESESIIQCDPLRIVSHNESCILPQEVTKLENLFQESEITKTPKFDSKTDSMSNSENKSDCILHTGEVETYSLSQDDTKAKNILKDDLATESSSQNDPYADDNVPQDEKKSENIIQGDSIESMPQNEAHILPQGNKSENIFQDEKIAESISQIDPEIDSRSQSNKMVKNIVHDAAEIKKIDQNEAYSPSQDMAKSENNILVDAIAENSTQNDTEIISVPQKDKNSENKVHGISEIKCTYQSDVYSLSQNEAKSEYDLQREVSAENLFHKDPEIVDVPQIDKIPDNIAQCEADVQSVLQNDAHILSQDDRKSENLLQEDLAAECSSQNALCSDNATQDDKKSENLLCNEVEVVNTFENEECSLSQKEAKPEKILHEKAVEENSFQNVPITDNEYHEGEKSENISGSDIEARIPSQSDAEAYCQSQKNAGSENVSQMDTEVDSLSQDDPQSADKLHVGKDAVSGCPSNTVQCDVPNLIDKTVRKDNVSRSSYPVLITNSSNINISCDVLKNLDYLPCTKDSVFTPDTDSEEIDVVNISNESKSDVGVTKTGCSTYNIDAIKEFSSVTENKSNSKSVKDKELSKENIEKSPSKSSPKVQVSEYTPRFCKNKDYVSFSDISLQNKNKNIVLDSGLKSPNPISNFSLAATAEIFCEYRNDIVHRDETDVLSRDDVSSNMNDLPDFTKSPSLSSGGSDEELDSPTYSSTEDSLTNETENICDEKSDKVAAKSSDLSLLNNNSYPVSENETNDKSNNVQDECMKVSTSNDKESNEKVLVRQSLRLRNKAEAKNKVSIDENPEADESSDKESKSAKEVVYDVIHKISSPKTDCIPCDDNISLPTGSNKNVSCILPTSEDNTLSHKSLSKKSIPISKRKSKIRAKDYVSPPKGYSLRYRKSRQLIDDSSNLGIDLTKLKLDSPSSKNTRSKSSTKDIKFAKLLTAEVNSQKSSDSNELTLSTKRETRSSSAKMEQDTTQNTPGYNLRTRTSIIAPGKLNI